MFEFSKLQAWEVHSLKIIITVVWDTDAWTVQAIHWPNACCCMGHRCLDCAGNSLA